MAFAVEDFEDLLRLLEEHPEWRQRLRAQVLGTSLDELPEIVRRLAEAQERTEARLERVAERVEELAEAQKRTETKLERVAERLGELAEAQKRTETKLEELVEQMRQLVYRMDRMTTEFGFMYELWFDRRAHGAFQKWLVKGRAVSADDAVDLLDAEDRGIITADEAQQIEVLDLLISGLDRKTREPSFLAVEVSRTINVDDVERASRRADILKRLGLPVRPCVAGAQIHEAAKNAADDAGVLVQIVRAQPPDVI